MTRASERTATRIRRGYRDAGTTAAVPSSIQAANKFAISAMLSALGLLVGCNSAQEHARNLRLPGLRELVCKGVPYEPKSQSCGDRSVWQEADLGLTAYITVYGISSIDEAEKIALYVMNVRKLQGQDHIPVNLRVYSTPRLLAREPAKFKILEKDL